MLEDLNIKDFALIDAASIEFGRGFTVLSGETGAGKSILIGALSFLLGGKGGIEQIRTGTHEASVSGTFLIENRAAEAWLSEHGIESEDNRVLLRRVVRDTGKSAAWIQSTPVTRADLADFSANLVDIHGQHEHQSLMRVPEHRRFLDSYAGILEEVDAFTALYTNLVEQRRRLDAMNSSDADRAQKIEMLSFAVKEISEAKLKSGEDAELEAEESRLASYEKLYDDITQINGALGADEGGVVPVLKRLRGIVNHAVSLDKTLEGLEGRLESSFYEISDIAEEFRSYEQHLVFDPARLEQVQDRLEVINKLKKKYASGIGSTVEDVLAYAEKAQQQLDAMGAGAQDKSKLAAEIAALEKQVYAEAKAISAKRRTAAAKMSAGVESVLQKLGMAGTRFSVGLTEKSGTDVTQKCGPFGMDDVEFLISANPGSPMLPLAHIASGGELSRVMLSLKTILAESDTVDTLVFDEIDTGIGGEVAVAVGSHMKALALKKQILCITHLASIAVYADNQIKIEKRAEDNTTRTQVFPITGEKRVSEIARMLSGDPTSAESLEHAKSMLAKFGG